MTSIAKASGTGLTNSTFSTEVEEQYLLYVRHMEGGRRATARSTSKDFINWTPQVLMSYSDTGTTVPSHHLYTNQTQPYFRAPHIYISLPARIIFADPRHVKTEGDKQLASRRQRIITPELREFIKENMPLMGTAGTGDHSDGVLLTTRAGSTVYDFTFRESFVRPGIGVNNWTTRTNYPACGIVPTGDGEMSFYVQRNYGQKGTAYLERMTLRLDGFASLNAPYQGGEMVTKPLRFKGSRLEINGGPAKGQTGETTIALRVVQEKRQLGVGQLLPVLEDGRAQDLLRGEPGS